MKYHHFARIDDPGRFRRKITPDRARRIVEMKDRRGLTWSAIAAWFTRNDEPVGYSAVREAYRRAKA